MFSISNNIISITRGDTGKFEIRILDAYKNIYTLEEGDTILFTVKKDTETSDVLIQKNSLDIRIDPIDTQDLKYGIYKYDIQVTLANGEVHTIIPASDFIIKEEVTF